MKKSKQEKTLSIASIVLNWLPLLVAVAATVAVVACTPGRISPYGHWISRLWRVARITTAAAVGFSLGAGIAWVFAKIVDTVEDRMGACFGLLSFSIMNTAAVLWLIALVALVPTAVWWTMWSL